MVEIFEEVKSLKVAFQVTSRHISSDHVKNNIKVNVLTLRLNMKTS